jgi:hypothetical protein
LFEKIALYYITQMLGIEKMLSGSLGIAVVDPRILGWGCPKRRDSPFAIQGKCDSIGA